MKPEKKATKKNGRRQAKVPSSREIREALESYLGVQLGDELDIGRNQGVLLTLSVPGTDAWIRGEFFPPNDERDHFEFVEPLIPFLVACAILRATPKTLYSRAPFMASSKKIGSRWFFRKKMFYEIDFAEETELPSRKEILSDRNRRRSEGEIMRGGRHANGCLKGHQGACKSRRQLTDAERASNRRRILDDLGK